MLKAKTITTLATATLLAGCGEPDIPVTPTPIPVERTVPEAKTAPLLEPLMDRAVHQRVGFSGAVLVPLGGAVVFSKGYGMADRKKGVANHPRTVFAVSGWFAQPFVATAVLQLEERGLMDVNEPIGTYLADYGIDQRVTAHHLLTHSSGIPDILAILGGDDRLYEDQTSFKEAFPKPIEELVNLFKDEPLEFTPGDRFSANSSNRLLLSLLIEEISGQPVEDYLQEHLFKPLGMAATRFCDAGTRSEDRAVGCETMSSETAEEEWAYSPLTTGRHGTGLLCTTVNDMYLWGEGLRLGTTIGIGQDSIAAMFSPYVEFEGSSAIGGSSGYGWGVEYNNQRRRFVIQTGPGPGAAAFIRWYPDEESIAVMLSNSLHAGGDDLFGLWVATGAVADFASATGE